MFLANRDKSRAKSTQGAQREESIDRGRCEHTKTNKEEISTVARAKEGAKDPATQGTLGPHGKRSLFLENGRSDRD